MRHEIILDNPIESLTVQAVQPIMIHTVRLFPGISTKLLQQILTLPLQALILETYGVGTAPENKDFMRVITQFAEKDIIMVNCSQCAHAKIKMQDYAASHTLKNAGVISGGDMTIEAVITKLFYLFSRQQSLAEIKSQMTNNLRGELSVN